MLRESNARLAARMNDYRFIDYADHHSGTMAMSPQRLNPYKIGIELFKSIEDR